MWFGYVCRGCNYGHNLFPTELNQARLRTEKWNSDQSRTDRTVRELRSQVDDLTEALGAKDGQLAVLKVRLDEADQLLKSRSSALEEAQTERSRYVYNLCRSTKSVCFIHY